MKKKTKREIKKVLRGVGRPSAYTDELADEICYRITNGESLKSLCETQAHFPTITTVFRWLADPRYAQFRDSYAQAREAFADGLVDDILPIADDASNDWILKHHGGQTVWVENGEAVRRSQLRVDARKWIASKLLPKKYGNKLDLNHSDRATNAIPAELIAAVESIRLAAASGDDAGAGASEQNSAPTPSGAA